MSEFKDVDYSNYHIKNIDGMLWYVLFEHESSNWYKVINSDYE